MSTRTLNILHVCDHLGWEGSRMHGVKRLFAWMMPRFDAARFNVSLVSLRKKDLSEETLESFGVDISYLHKSKFDPATLTALLKIIDRKSIDVLHLHGYGATTFGRAAAAMRRLPAILHEHANLTDTPWFQKVADRALEPFTDIAIAVSKSTAEFVVNARLDPGAEGQGRLPRRPVRRVQPRARRRRRSPRPAGRSASAPGDFAIGTVTRLHDSKGNEYLVDAARLVLDVRPGRQVLPRRRRPAPRRPSRRRPRALGLGDRFVFAGFAKDVAATLSAFDMSVFPSLWEGTPLTAFEALAAGQAHRRHRRRRPAGHPAPRSRRAHRAEARRAGAGRPDARADGLAGRARAALRERPRDRRAATTSARSCGRWSGCTRSCTTSRAARTAGACSSRTCRS